MQCELTHHCCLVLLQKKKTGEGEDESTGKAPAAGSVEYWNAERAKLGLKPLNSKGKK